MKKNRIPMILLFLTGLLIVGACEKLEDPKLADEQSLEALENDAELKGAGIDFTIVVEPEGPAYDTENLLNAFQEASERPGRTLIKLTRGTYYLDQIVIHDFEGWFRGEGKTRTFIHPIAGGINIPVTSPAFDAEPFFLNFCGGDIRISDMTIDINLDEPVVPFDWYMGGQVTFMGAVIRISGSTPENYTANSLIRNVSFKGKYVELIDFTPFNIDNAILVGGGFGMLPLGGKHTVQDCDFLCLETGINSLGASHSSLVFGGAPSHGNTMTNVNCGILAVASEASDFRISFNRMEEVHTYGGILIQQADIPPGFGDLNPGGSKYMIMGNTIDLAPDPYSNAIALLDYLVLSDPNKQSDIKVIGNKASLCMPEQWFIAVYAPNEIKAIHNKVSGEADLGIYVGGPVHGCQFLNNDFGSFNCTFVDIYLDPDTHDNMVVAQDHTTVWNDGTDNIFRGNVELLGTALKSTSMGSAKARFSKEKVKMIMNE